MVTNHLLDLLLGLYTYTYPHESSIECTEKDIEVPRPQGFRVSEIVNGIAIDELYSSILADLNNNNHKYWDEARVCVFIAKKVNLDSLTLGYILQKMLRCKNFTILGLKETKAETHQIVILTNCKRMEKHIHFHRGRLDIDVVLWFCTDNMPILIHKFNKFHITFNVKKPECIQYILSRINILINNNSYMLNFFGYQRFGTRNPITHILGKKILEGDGYGFLELLCRKAFKPPAQALEKILCNLNSDKLQKTLSKLARISYYRSLFELFVQAYQAYLFNKLLSMLWLNLLEKYIVRDALKKLKRDYVHLPVPGYKTRIDERISKIYNELLAEENVKPEMFCVEILGNKCFYGDYRESIVAVEKLYFRVEGNNALELKFLLPPGSYATILVREILPIVNPLIYT
jgi:tRNA pseudouridine13 synthase